MVTCTHVNVFCHHRACDMDGFMCVSLYPYPSSHLNRNHACICFIFPMTIKRLENAFMIGDKYTLFYQSKSNHINYVCIVYMMAQLNFVILFAVYGQLLQ